MEIASIALLFLSHPLIIASILTFLSFLLTFRSFFNNPLLAFSFSASLDKIQGKSPPPPPSPSCNGTTDTAAGTDDDLMAVADVRKPAAAAAAAAPVVERQTGASMMEQLVPEITTHALSYLDYPSLCRLSMTNSLMRKAANDDNAWKALYHKDFTLEQDTMTPVNGWKAYYAATRAIMNVNAQFFNIIRERSLPAMSHFWLNADYVKCIHATGEHFSGHTAVIQSWEPAFNAEQGVDFQVRDVRARVLTDMAWVTMKTYVDMDTGPFYMTNVFEFHNGQWYMVHHHSSVMLGDGDMVE